MRILLPAALIAALSFVVPAAPLFAQAQAPLTAEEAEEQALAAKIRNGLHPQHGEIAIKPAGATLHLGKDYYYLPAAEAKTVLVDAWGNSPEAAKDVLGMIFPEGKDFADDTWAAVVTYQDLGHISDNDANSMDYDEILRGQQATEGEENQQRKAEGLEPVHLVGWAQPPTYDAARHVLVWARDIAFEGQSVHTLNYDLRALGRAGVLSMNIIAPMDQLNDVRTAATALGPIAAFNSGSRYTDFVAGTDKDSGYGLAGLVAAGVGVAAAQKLGLLAVFLLFVKKAGILIVAGGAAAVAGARKFFRRNTPT